MATKSAKSTTKKRSTAMAATTSYAKEITLLITNFATDVDGVVIENFMLYPGQGEWEATPPPPTVMQPLTPNNLVTFKVGNSTPTGGIQGFILVALGTYGFANVGFTYLQGSYGANINGQASVMLGQYQCSVSAQMYSNQLTVTINVGQKVGTAPMF